MVHNSLIPAGGKPLSQMLRRETLIDSRQRVICQNVGPAQEQERVEPHKQPQVQRATGALLRRQGPGIDEDATLLERLEVNQSEFERN